MSQISMQSAALTDVFTVISRLYVAHVPLLLTSSSYDREL
jgi:hypothetical protein